MIELEVDSEAEEDDTYDKVIEDYYLSDVSDYSLTFNVTFRTIQDITPLIYDPDILLVHFAVPELILDAETFEHLGED